MSEKLPENLHEHVSIFLKVDCNNGRAGTFWDDPKSVELAVEIEEKFRFVLKGLYAHCGNTYGNGGSLDFVKKVATSTAEKVLILKEKILKLRPKDRDQLTVGIGSTPTCSLMNKQDPDWDILKKLDEIHVGNYTFYDLMQKNIGSCEKEEIAAYLYSRVISIKNDKSNAILDCGFTGISKQGCDNEVYLREVICCKNTDDIKLDHFSQEHGVITGSGIANLKIGQGMFLLPWHSCVFSALHSCYFIVEEEGDIDEESIITDVLDVCRGWI